MSRSKELAKNTLIITAGRVSTQFISFLLLPMYTSLLSREEYGTVDFITTLVSLLIPVASLMVDQGVFRHLLNCETEEEKRKVVSSAFSALVVSVTGVLAVCAVVTGFFSLGYRLWLILILAAMAFSNFFLQVARGLKHTADYALGSFVCSSFTILLNVLCIAGLRMGASGMLIATFFGNAACCAFLCLKLRVWRYVSPRARDRETIRSELTYSLPLIPNQLSLWVMNSSDRLIVMFFLGAGANGLLAVSHKFPVIYMTFYHIFQLAWHETGAVHFFDEDRDQFFTDMFHRIMTVFATLCMGVMVVLPLVFPLLARGDFGEAYYNIPIYLVASLFNVITGFLGVIYVATKRTAEIAKTTVIAAVVNIIVHLALIRAVGLYAASVSTFVGYMVVMFRRIVDTKNYVRIRYDKRRVVVITAAIAICCYLYYLNNKIVSVLFLPFFAAFAWYLNREVIDAAIGVAEEKTGIARKKIVALAICLAVAATAVCGLIVYRKLAGKPAEIEKAYKGTIQELTPEEEIRFSDFGSMDFTCTGLTYDGKNGTFWIADYGADSPDGMPAPRLVEVDGEFRNIVGVVALKNIMSQGTNLQGVAYDAGHDTLWLAYGSGICEISKNGALLRDISLGKYAGNLANGICLDERDDTIWVLCARKTLLHLEQSGGLLDAFPFNYADQDHVCMYGGNLYATVGADYLGISNFICRINPADGKVERLYRAEGANSLEGVCYRGGQFFVANDGLYHHDKNGYSYITIFPAEQFEEDKN